MRVSETLSPRAAYRLWARTWDQDASAIVALESRCLLPLLPEMRGKCVVDVGCGTGRWLAEFRRRGAVAVGVDLSVEMLGQAARKPGLAGLLAAADAERLPFPDGCADLVLCALTLGHLPDPAGSLGELVRLARPGGAVWITDFHPEAARRGWKRTFRSGERTYEIRNHWYGKAELERAGEAAGLELEEWREPCFGEPEREIFREAGREDLFEAARGTPAVLLARWRRK
ncbi:MAG TPA: class I SAM-dependent methyltransferase [Bryobacteraceae bacterium]|nr:class I SAM-dependent methyltransferase [Bryobacteraceae bacterium]